MASVFFLVAGWPLEGSSPVAESAPQARVLPGAGRRHACPGCASLFSTHRVERHGGLLWTSACKPCRATLSWHGCFLSTRRWRFSTQCVESDGGLLWTTRCERCTATVFSGGQKLSTPRGGQVCRVAGQRPALLSAGSPHGAWRGVGVCCGQVRQRHAWQAFRCLVIFCPDLHGVDHAGPRTQTPRSGRGVAGINVQQIRR